MHKTQKTFEVGEKVWFRDKNYISHYGTIVRILKITDKLTTMSVVHNGETFEIQKMSS